MILIIVMATHCLVCGSRMQQHCGLICAAGALSHEKSHAVNLIGAPEIRTATSSSPRNRSKYTRPSSPCRGGVWDRDYLVVSFPDPIPTRGKGSGVLRAISWASRMQNSHVILIIVMATHCLVCGSRMQAQQHCGLICAAGALSHEKSHAVNLIGAPEIGTATSSSPRNRSKYTRPSSLCRGGVWDRD